MTYRQQDDRDAEIERLQQRVAELEAVESKTVVDQISEAEAAGDWNTSINLKTQHFYQGVAEADAATRPVPDEETQTKIGEMEEAGDWMGVAQAKVAASQPQAPTVDPDIVARIAELESQGRWVESGRMKAQLAGVVF